MKLFWFKETQNKIKISPNPAYRTGRPSFPKSGIREDGSFLKRHIPDPPFIKEGQGGIFRLQTGQKLQIIIFTLTLMLFCRNAESAETGSIQHGRELYKEYCMTCHGENGKGNGPATRYLFPKPRDLTMGVFKVRSTSTGEPPTDKDIMNILKNGMPGSSMPAFVDLPDYDIESLITYVKDLGDITEEPYSVIEPGTPPPVTPQLIERGREIYWKVRCWECHGEKGKGDGPKADELIDDLRQPAPPNVFTYGIYKGGGDPSEIYLRFTSGMDGSPMPSYEDSLNTEERWAVVYYTLSLAGPAIAKQPTSGKIVAKRISGNIPIDPESSSWNHTTAFKIPLMSMWQNSSVPPKQIKVKSLHNEKDIGVLIEWQDTTHDVSLGLDLFRDAASLQFPLEAGKAPASFWMGDETKKEKSGTVNIWFWRADLQEKINNGWQSLIKTPVDNLIASGFGTLKENSPENIFGKGIWKNGKWTVVFKREMKVPDNNTSFSVNKTTPVSFSLWDGSEKDVDGKKAVSTWYYLAPES